MQYEGSPFDASTHDSFMIQGKCSSETNHVIWTNQSDWADIQAQKEQMEQNKLR